MIKLPGAVVGTLAGGAFIFGGLDIIANNNDGPTNVEQVNACAKHLGDYSVGAVSSEASKLAADALKKDCGQFINTWTAASVNLTKQGANSFILNIPNVAAFSDTETPPAKQADSLRGQIRIGETVVVSVAGTIGGLALASKLSDGFLGFPRRKRAGNSTSS